MSTAAMEYDHPTQRAAMRFRSFRTKTPAQLEKLGLVPFDFHKFWGDPEKDYEGGWASERFGKASSGERAILSFLWEVQYGGKDGPVPPLRLRDLVSLDDENREAIAAWAADTRWWFH